MFYLLLFFLAGVVLDFFFTMNLKFVSKGKTPYATVCSFVIVLIDRVVNYGTIKGLDAEKSILAIIAYALGVATGTYLAMKFPAKAKQKRQRSRRTRRSRKWQKIRQEVEVPSTSHGRFYLKAAFFIFLTFLLV